MCIIDQPIETARLRLRAPRMADAPRIAALANDPQIARMTSQLPYPYALSDAESFLAHTQSADCREEANFVIEADGEGPIGMIGLAPKGGLAPEIGYWLGRVYWGRGLATEAAAATLAWARDVWRRRAVLSGHFADNPASGRVLVKAGFLYTGEVTPRLSRARAEPADTRMMVWLA